MEVWSDASMVRWMEHGSIDVSKDGSMEGITDENAALLSLHCG